MYVNIYVRGWTWQIFGNPCENSDPKFYVASNCFKGHWRSACFLKFAKYFGWYSQLATQQKDLSSATLFCCLIIWHWFLQFFSQMCTVWKKKKKLKFFEMSQSQNTSTFHFLFSKVFLVLTYFKILRRFEYFR